MTFSRRSSFQSDITQDENSEDSSTIPQNTNAAIVIVAKCPIAGKSKTRLSPLLGDEGSGTLAQAMLSDVLERVGRCPAFKMTLKVLLYVPADEESEAYMQALLTSLRRSHEEEGSSVPFLWMLMPMSTHNHDLTSPNQGDILKNALLQVRELLVECRSSKDMAQEDGGIVFIGKDAPDVPLDELHNGLLYSSPPHNQAFLCPKPDGGYGMIAIPPRAPPQIFDGVRWSDPLTLVSQMKSLSDRNIPCVLGKLMYDVDEPKDVWELADRLYKERSYYWPEEPTGDSLLKNSPFPHDTVSVIYDDGIGLPCKWTRKALVVLGLVKEQEENGRKCFIVSRNNLVVG